MKIGIFTFHCAVNYGAVLQTYCLQEVLKNLGHEVYVIDYRPKYLLDPYRSFQFQYRNNESFLSKCIRFVRACIVAPIRWKRNVVFSKFMKNHLCLSKLDLNDESNDFDVFIFGSDQIWNPIITKGFDKVYLGDFPAAKGKKLIAYGASAGSVMNLSIGDIDYFFYRMEFFNKIMVREKSLADYIKEKSSINVETVLDPVLLAGREVLDKLSSNKKIFFNSFLLLFQLTRDDVFANYAMNLAEKKKLDFVEFATMGESLFNRKMKQTVSIERLLCYFKNSSYIITSSFHGTVISILYNKEFNTMSVNKSVDERVLSLLEILGLSDRMIKVSSVSNERINYSNVENILRSYRQRSIFLLKSYL